MLILNNAIAQSTNDGWVNLAKALPYLGIFSVVLALVRIIVVRSDSSDTAEVKAMQTADERMLEQFEKALLESEAKCMVRLEAAEAECERRISKLATNLKMVAMGMDILIKEYPENQTLQLLSTTLKDI